MEGFWNNLKKPIFLLAPLADVTDAAFRRVIAKYGKPDVMFTEFVSCDGLCSAGKERLMTDLMFTEAERPIVAQIFGAKPDNIARCAELIRTLGFDGIDINMGCPDRAVEKQGAGAALIKDPKLAKELIIAAKHGAGDIPVSVKTRIGYAENTVGEWTKHLLSAEPSAIIFHARTRKEMSAVPAHWDAIACAVEIAKGSGTLIIGNGDVGTLAEAERRTQETGADGVMIGRGVFGNPWLFSRAEKQISIQERLAVMCEHAALFEKLFSGIKNFSVMRKHFGAYALGFDGAKELREQLMKTMCAKEVSEVVYNMNKIYE